MRAIRYLVKHWEFLLAAALFVICVYAAVFYVIAEAYGSAGFALATAFGFFQALMAFADHAELRRRMGLEQGAEDL